MFGAVRIRQDYQTRNRKERPTHLKVKIGRSVGDHWDAQGEIEVPVEDVPVFLVLPVSALPTILTRMEPQPLAVWYHVNEKELDAFREKYGGGFGHSTMKPLTFFRLLAKIAHGYAVGSLGYGAFEPLLCDLILGTNEKMTDLIGISPEPAPNEGSVFCHLRMRECTSDGVMYFGVNVCLFADLGAPTYLVVAGKKISAKKS